MESYPLVVIGAGAGGLVVAIGYARAGKKVLLIEADHYGGECTNYGCIPSKSLIASANIAHCLKKAEEFGVHVASKEFSTTALLRTEKIIEKILSHEDSTALLKAGVQTLKGKAHFESEHVVVVNGEKIWGKRFVIATGSFPFIPEIKGLKSSGFLTYESVFKLDKIPKSMTVLGGGPIGCELSQAFSRLGTKVSLIHSHTHLLDKEEKLAQTTIAEQFEKEGINLYLNSQVKEVVRSKEDVLLILEDNREIRSAELFVSVGKRPNLADLQLQNTGIDYSEKGIKVDAFSRTTKKHIWAVGDVTGAPFFTHLAEYQARNALLSILMPLCFKKKKQAIPRVTYTDPEIASIGLSEEEAKKRYKTATYHIPFSSLDRAITSGGENGFIKIITKKWSSKILGCTIVSARAGEMLGEIATAMYGNIPLRKLAKMIHPYPGYNQAIRKAADLWLTQTILPLFKKTHD